MFVKFRLESGALTTAILINEDSGVATLCILDAETNSISFEKEVKHGHDKNEWHLIAESLG